MIKKEPIRFVPYLKSVIWGGEKICRYKGIPQTEPNIGESWEISAVPGHESIVVEGDYKGMSITELIERFGEELLGKDVMTRYAGKFPLLIKLIDANDNLSVQVHPDDELAKKRHDSLGKTEMWYIIEAEEGARIYAGLNVAMTPEDYVRRVAEGSFAETLAVHDSAAGDVFFLPAGRVHAIGAGNLLAEIQESSDITYRIYDYDRRDKDGNARELHTELAKDAIDYHIEAEYKNPPVPKDMANARIVECRHFSTNRISVNGEIDIDMASDSFYVLMCVAGKVMLRYPSGVTELTQGSTVLIPAVIKTATLEGHGTVLMTHG